MTTQKETLPKCFFNDCNILLERNTYQGKDLPNISMVYIHGIYKDVKAKVKVMTEVEFLKGFMSVVIEIRTYVFACLPGFCLHVIPRFRGKITVTFSS